MNIVFVLIPEKGHVNPYIGPAQVLAARGHAVTVLAPGDLRAQLAAAGLAFAPDLIPETPGARPTHGAELVALIQDAERLAAWIEELLLSDIAAQVKAIRESLRRLRAEVVVIDPLYYAAAIAAHAEGTPWASVSNSLNPVLPPELDSALIRTTARLGPRRDALFASYGMAATFRGADVLSPNLTVAFTTEELCGTVEGIRLAGPSFPRGRRGDETSLLPIPEGKPVVYASFGSQIYHWPSLFQRLCDAARDEFHLILSVGDLADSLAPAPHCQHYRYAPQQEILRRTDVFVTHGGANSFMEAVAAGVPMLLSPMCNDQFHQAYFLERAGIGRTADLRLLPVEALRNLLRELAGPGPHREALAALTGSYRRDGAVLAADWVERLGS
ncbi:MAG TPA: glycosyltransferase [Bryobacteraceae bacterium]|nr:glycosyltransferase [Bryobacteraceae bacterium]